MTAVLFGTNPSPRFKVVSGSVIEASAPPGAGAVSVRVTDRRRVYHQEVFPVRTLTFLLLARSVLGPGRRVDTVLITGNNVSEMDSVWFGDHPGTGLDAFQITKSPCWRRRAQGQSRSVSGRSRTRRTAVQRGGSAASLHYRYSGNEGPFSARRLPVVPARRTPAVASVGAVDRDQSLAPPNPLPHPSRPIALAQ